MTNLDREILAYCSNRRNVSVDDVATALSEDYPPYLVRKTAINLIFHDLLDAELNANKMMDGTDFVPGYIMGLTPAGYEVLHPPRRIGFG